MYGKIHNKNFYNKLKCCILKGSLFCFFSLGNIKYRRNYILIYWQHAKGAILLITQVIQLILSVILYFIIFFGIAFILNMLLRRTWLMAILYPIIISIIVGDSRISEYFTTTYKDLSATFHKMISLPVVDIVILSSGFAGTLVSGIVVRLLRKSGYRMF